MSCPLAILTSEYGVAVQTFIRRHVEDLLPGHTVVVARRHDRSADAGWNASVPVLALDQLRPGLAWRGARAVADRVGWRLASSSTAAVEHFFVEHGVRVVMGEHLDTSLEWWPSARKLGLRFFGHAHGYDVSSALRNPHWRDAYRRYNDADGVITISRVSRDRLVAAGLLPTKVHVVPCGVDVPAEPPARPARPLVRCLAVGRMVGKKAPLLALDAFRRAVAVSPELRLDMVGAGPLFPAAAEFVRCLGLESTVTLHGARTPAQVQRMMRDADVFIQHSITSPKDGNEEGLPVAILEAMASGLPVVSTRHAGIPEAVQEGVTGCLVDEGDTFGMAEHLVYLASHADERQAMGRAGWARAKAEFSWEGERARLTDILGLDHRAPESPG